MRASAAVSGDGAGQDAEWKEGDIILGLYQVRGILGGGGAGRVYRVRHLEWKTDMAVKSLMPGKPASREIVSNFVTEAEAWLKLGRHPNIVTCHRIHTIDGVPRIFAECVEGGALSDWVRSGRLYAGGRAKALVRILDLAIQISWALDYIHDRDLVHQDIKPGNVLMTPDGTAKVSDFGLARARAVISGPAAAAPNQKQTLRTPGAGSYTREYASPEQIEGKILTRRSDIWSWAVSLLHLFKGELTWMIATAAPAVLENYLATEQERLPAAKMPPDLVELMRNCLRNDPDSRPRNMKEVIGALKSIYRTATGFSFPRKEPVATDG